MYENNVPQDNTHANTADSGDACHPMLPYLAQGANSSLEDGAVLGALLAHVRSRDQLPQALAMFQALRKQRGERIVRETFKQVRVVPQTCFPVPHQGARGVL
jgi:salicylate hydroxylase